MKKIKFSHHDYLGIRKILLDNPKKRVFSFLTPYCIWGIHNNPSFKKAMANKKIARTTSMDSTGICLALSVKNLKVLSRQTGPETTDQILKDKELIKNKKHFFVGIEEKNLKNLIKRYPLLERKNVKGIGLPWITGLSFSKEIKEDIIKKVKSFKPDYIWVGAGTPRQEILTDEIYDKINFSALFNVGVALKYIQGKQKQAPKFFRSINLEWLYRLVTDFSLTSRRLKGTFMGTLLAFSLTELEK